MFPGPCVVECAPWAVYHMVDEAGGDDKVLCVPADVRFDDIKDIDDVNEYHKAEIKHSSSNTRLWSRARKSCRATTGLVLTPPKRKSLPRVSVSPIPRSDSILNR